MKIRFVLPLLLSCVVMAQTPGTFTATGNLNTGRFHHTATLLPNGKVLIAGGSYSHPTIPIDAYFDVLASAELYDPAKGAFTPAGNMTMHRTYHTATLLPNGKVLIVGGALLTTGYQPPSAELYDPSTGTFTPTGDTTIARLGGHSATLLNDGTVLIAGGFQDPGTAEIYDPSTGTFHAIANTIVHHERAIATLLSDGRVLLDGGLPYAGAEIYDPVAGIFTFAGLGIDPSENSPVAAALLTNGEVLQTLGPACDDCGTRNAELFDPSTSVFSATPQTSSARGLFAGYDTATLLPGGVLTISGQAELFDPMSSTFISAGPMTMFRAGQTATLLGDGTVLIAGGQDTGGNAPGSTAEIYYPAALISAPLLFSLSGDGQGQGAIWHSATGQVASSQNPAFAGEILSMYTTSLFEGGVIPPQVAIGGRLAEILFFGNAPGYPGYYQVNFLVPDGVAPGSAVLVRLTYIGRPSNAVTIGVQ